MQRQTSTILKQDQLLAQVFNIFCRTGIDTIEVGKKLFNRRGSLLMGDTILILNNVQVLDKGCTLNGRQQAYLC